MLGKMKSINGVQITGNNSGSCHACQIVGASCPHLFCVDFSGSYKGKKFVADAKFYQGRYLSAADVVKLLRDKKQAGASKAFFLLYDGKVGADKEAELQKKKIGIIYVKKAHWKVGTKEYLDAH